MATRADRLLWVLAGFLFLAVVVVAWIKVSPILNPTLVAVAPLNNRCDLRAGSCEVAFPQTGARVAFEVTPRQIPVAEKLRLAVRTEGVEARTVEVDFAGVDMNMGYNRARLEQTGPGEFSGTGMLPVCVRDRMTWEARVLLQTQLGLIAAPFRFETFRPGEVPAAMSVGGSDE
jgi:hypothetical protein